MPPNQITFNYNKDKLFEQYKESRSAHGLLQRIETELMISGWNDYEIRTAQLLTVIDFNVKQQEQIVELKKVIDRMMNKG
jgi:hypothetical protein